MVTVMVKNEKPQNAWQGKWIGYDVGRDAYDPQTPYFCADDFDKGQNKLFLPPCPLLRGILITESKPISAVLMVSALGLTDIWINGQPALQEHMVPGVCDYRKRVYFRSFDVTELIVEGENCIGAVLADGWYAGYIGLTPRQWWGDSPRLSIQLELNYENGQFQRFVSDEHWRAADGPWLYADILHGEGYDARLLRDGWNCPGFDDSDWSTVVTDPTIKMSPQEHPGVAIIEHERFKPKLIRSSEHTMLYDMGQCFSGVVRFSVRGEKSARIDIYHAEEIIGNDLYLRGNRAAEAHDCYILKGNNSETYQPRFTYHGFRYCKIVLTGFVELLELEGIAISSELPDATVFETSNVTINAIYKMICSTAQSNQVEFPTDVCARDERLGWGTEGHLFMRTATYLNNNQRFLRKWLQDILDSQMENGAFWANAPAVMMKDVIPFAGDLQSDMGIHVSWLLMQMYADYEAVSSSFGAMEKYFSFLLNNNDRFIRFAVGQDWLDIEDDGHSDLQHGYGQSPSGVIGTACFAHAATMMSDIAAFIGLTECASKYRSIYRQIRSAFRTYFIQRDGSIRNATQGTCCLAIAYDLLDAHEMKTAAEQLVSMIKDAGGVRCGTASIHAMLPALAKTGHTELALEWLNSSSYPGFGYMLKNGATTVWERWDGIKDGRFHPHPMNAFDHIGFAAAGEWLITGLAGIFPLKPGFTYIGLKPTPGKQVGALKTIYKSIRGDIEVDWKHEEGTFRYKCTVPEGTTARIWLPVNQGGKVSIECCEGEVVKSIRDEDRQLLEVKSGYYEFITDYQS